MTLRLQRLTVTFVATWVFGFYLRTVSKTKLAPINNSPIFLQICRTVQPAWLLLVVSNRWPSSPLLEAAVFSTHPTWLWKVLLVYYRHLGYRCRDIMQMTRRQVNEDEFRSPGFTVPSCRLRCDCAHASWLKFTHVVSGTWKNMNVLEDSRFFFSFIGYGMVTCISTIFAESGKSGVK